MRRKKQSPSSSSTSESLDEFRKSLGPTAAQYSDAQLKQIQLELQALAEMLVDLHTGVKIPL